MSEASLRSAGKIPWFFKPSYTASLVCCYPYPHPQRHEMSLAAYPEYQHLWMFYIKGEIEGPLSRQLLPFMCIFIKYILQFNG